MARSLIGETIDVAAQAEKSPLVEGFVAGLKAALLGAPIGAGVQALRDKSPMTGAVIGAVIPGLLAGLARAGEQKIENLGTEAALRYHAENIKEREPYFFMPPRHELGRYFSRRFEVRPNANRKS